MPGAQTHHSTHTEGQRQEEMTFIIHSKKDNSKLLFLSAKRGLASNIMKRLLCGTEQYKTSILINSHFFVCVMVGGEECVCVCGGGRGGALQDEWAGAAGF